METQRPMIEVQDLAKHYDGVRAVDGISFQIRPGEVVGFLGPNGAGKTTTMKVLTTFIGATSGKAFIDGLDVSTDSLEVRRRVGYLPESAPLYADMMVLDYLRWVAEMRLIDGEARTDRIREIAEKCAIGEVLGKDIGELSKGFRRRVALAQALLHEPDCLILDEPTEGLDPNQIIEIRELIKTIGREKTILLSSHILPEVQATCGRVLIINRGKIVADGTAEELQEKEASHSRLFLQFELGEGGSRVSPEAIREALQKVAHVRTARLAEGEAANIAGFEVRAEGMHDVRAEIFRLAVAQRWTLLEMRREMVSLEDVFRRLTAS
jgi:ABC-2 type transport system ATP-binding protein